MVDLKELIKKGSFFIDVKTNQKSNDLIFKEDKVVVFVKEKPENNKANEGIERFLTKKLGKNVRIVRGKTSKKKLVKID